MKLSHLPGEMGNRIGEGNALTNIGVAYYYLGELQKALENYNEALPIFREIGNRRMEAAALDNIGTVYYALGDLRKSLEKHNEALPIIRKVGDRNSEANTLTNIGVVYHTWERCKRRGRNTMKPWRSSAQ